MTRKLPAMFRARRQSPTITRRLGAPRVAGLLLAALGLVASCDLMFSYSHTERQGRDGSAGDARADGARDLRAAEPAPLPPSPYSCVEHAACLLQCAAGGRDCAVACGAELAAGAILPPGYGALAACHAQNCTAQCTTFELCAACLTSACAEPLYYCFLEPEQPAPLSCPELWACAVRCQYGNPCGYNEGCHPKGDAEAQGLAQAIIGGCNPSNPYLACRNSCPPNQYYFSCYLACNALGTAEIIGCLAAMRDCFADFR